MGGTVFLQAMSFALKKKKNLCNVHFQEGVEWLTAPGLQQFLP